MKIVMVHRFFWPDTPPYAVMLRHIAGRLSTDGHLVTVVSTQPSYKSDFHIEPRPWQESLDGFMVKRLKMKTDNRNSMLSRIFSMLTFSFKLFLELLRQKPEIITIATTPQIIGGLVVRWASNIIGAKYVYHCQDIYPEVANASGHLKIGLMFRLLQAIDRKTCDRAFATVVLSEDMRNTLLERGCHGHNIQVINNFELVTFNEDNRGLSKLKQDEHLLRKSDKFRVIFAGNIGRFQGLETVIESAHLLEDIEDIEFVFLGEGQARQSLETQAGDLLHKTVHFYGHQPLPIARSIIADSELCVISLSPDIYRYAYPSKTMTYLCESVPVAVIAELESELSQTVQSAQLGISVAAGDAKGLAQKIRGIKSNKKLLNTMKQNARSYSEAYFRVESVLPKWSKLVKQES